MPFIDLNDVPVDEYYAPQMDPNTARQHSFVPVMADMGKLILASPEPISLDVEDELRLLFDLPVRCAICTPTQINAAIAKMTAEGKVEEFRAFVATLQGIEEVSAEAPEGCPAYKKK